MEPKRLIEAALFMSGREMSVPELKKLTGIASAGHVKEIVEELAGDYDSMGSSIEVFEGDNAYILRVRDEYSGSVRQFAQDVAISKSALRTLSYIAKHNGILKSEVVRRIGSVIYDDVKELVENGFVFQRKYGRSSKLFLTDKFRAYFEKGAGTVSTSPKKAVAGKESSGDSEAAPPEAAPASKDSAEGAAPSEDSGETTDEDSPAKEGDFSFSDMDESAEEDEKFED
ncbi:SMC-Scp complex subunit ScpB [Candidatus Micrarchaeota archaeon]|nr:SMC-Scp complex subunit ScpB [Candidatus Micrarchaeota archaeon]